MTDIQSKKTEDNTSANPQYMQDKARQWLDGGFEEKLIYLDKGDKAPSLPDWPRAKLPRKEILARMAKGHNLGLLNADFPVFDIEGTEYADDILAIIKKWRPDAPVRSRDGSTSKAVLVRYNDPIESGVVWTVGGITEDDGTDKGRKIFEILGVGKQTHVEGNRADAGGVYLEWDKQPVADELPEVDFYDLRDIFAEVKALLESKGVKLRAATGERKPGQVATADGCDEETLKKLVALIPNGADFVDRDKWVEMGHAIYGASGGSGEGRDVWLDWCSQVEQKPNAPESFWDTVRPENVRLGAEYLFDTARRYAATEVARMELANAPLFEIEPEGNADRLKLNWDTALQRLRYAQDEVGHAEALAGNQSGGEGKLLKMDWGGIKNQTANVRPHISDWHTRCEVQQLLADPFAGKSTLCLFWALAMCLERPDLVGDTKIDWAGSVVFISNEDGAQIIQSKVKAYMQEFGIKPDEFKHNFHLWSNSLQIVSKTKDGVAPTNAAVNMVDKLAKLRETESIAWLLIDTFASAVDGDENLKSDVQPAMNCAAEIAKAGFLATTLIHHKKKSANPAEASHKDGRGSGAIGGSVRLSAAVTKPDPGLTGWTEDECRRRIRFEVTDTNGRNPSDCKPRYFEFKTVSIPAVDPRNPGVATTEEVGILVLIPPPTGKDWLGEVRMAVELALASGEVLSTETSTNSETSCSRYVHKQICTPGKAAKKELEHICKALDELVSQGVLETYLKSVKGHQKTLYRLKLDNAQ